VATVEEDLTEDLRREVLPTEDSEYEEVHLEEDHHLEGDLLQEEEGALQEEGPRARQREVIRDHALLHQRGKEVPQDLPVEAVADPTAADLVLNQSKHWKKNIGIVEDLVLVVLPGTRCIELSTLGTKL